MCVPRQVKLVILTSATNHLDTHADASSPDSMLGILRSTHARMHDVENEQHPVVISHNHSHPQSTPQENQTEKYKHTRGIIAESYRVVEQTRCSKNIPQQRQPSTRSATKRNCPSLHLYSLGPVMNLACSSSPTPQTKLNPYAAHLPSTRTARATGCPRRTPASSPPST